MDSLFGLLCFFLGLAVLLAVVAVLGHGLWLLAANIFSFGSNQQEWGNRHRLRTIACIGCGTSYSFVEPERCPHCGLDPESKEADELRDLEATARTVQRMHEQEQLPAETCEVIYQGIESRQESLLKRSRRRYQREDPSAERSREWGALKQLEAWFSADLGKALTVEEKKQALALSRTLLPADFGRLSARTLVGIARLLSSLGMLSRACEIYLIVLECYPRAFITPQAAVDALQLVCKLEDWPRGEKLLQAINAIPNLLEDEPELSALIQRVQTRTAEPSAPPTPIPASAPILEVSQPVEEMPATLPVVTVAPATVELATAPVPLPPVAPRRSFAEWIAVFMEERNILWGELIGGTLIIGCSIALVISLWRTLEENPYFPFLIFAAITSALFGAGFYTLHRWKLESTSRGLLLISTLLVPLNCLVLAGVPWEQSGMAWLQYPSQILSLGLFTWCVYRALRVLVETPIELNVPSSAVTTASIMIGAVVQLSSWEWLQPNTISFSLLSLLPIVVQLGAMAVILIPMSRLQSWSLGRLVALLIALGSTSFAGSMTQSFLMYVAYFSDDLGRGLPYFAPALTLLGSPLLIAGILIQKKVAVSFASEPDAQARDNGSGSDTTGLWRTLGTGLALLGLFFMFGGFAVAVNQPVLRWISGTINIVTLLSAAWILRVPALHVPAQLYLAVLIVTGGYTDVETILHHPAASLRLVGLFLLQALVAEGLILLRRPLDAPYYAVGSAVSTVLAGLLILRFADTDPGTTAIVFGVAGVTWLCSNLRWRSGEITYACAVVLAGSSFFAYQYYVPEAPFAHQLLWSMLIHSTLCLGAGALLRLRPSLSGSFREPLEFASLFASFLAAGVIVLEQFHFGLSWPISGAACCWLAALWLALAVLQGSATLFVGFQLALGFAWFFGASAWLTDLGWDWLEPHSLHVYALGLGSLSLVWELSRIAERSKPRVLALLSPPFVPLDRIISAGLVLGQCMLLALLILWRVGQELSPTPNAWRVFPEAWYESAFSAWGWLLTCLLAGVMVLWTLEIDFRIPLFGLVLLFLTFPLLAAGAWFADDLAAASALRWGLTFAYGVCSLLLWNRHRLDSERAEAVPAFELRILVLVTTLVPTLFISAIVVVKKLTHQPIPGPLDGIFSAIGGPVSLLTPLILSSAILAGHGLRERLASYMLAAGLLANASAVGAYFLVLQRLEIDPSQPWVVFNALMVAAGSVWLWTIFWAWLASRLETGDSRPLLDSPLLTVHGIFGAVLFGLAMWAPLSWIMFFNDEPGRLWTLAAGSVWSWLVFASLVGGSCYLFWKRYAALPLYLLGILGLTAVGVSACTVEVILGNERSFTALMFGSSLFACAWVAMTLRLNLEHPPRWLSLTHEGWESVVYAAVASGLAIFLSCSALVTNERAIWSAATAILAAISFALLAYQRKTELWASLASATLVLASTILVLYFDEEIPWLRAWQIGVAVLGGASLLRLALNRHLMPAESEWSYHRQLPMQIALCMLANMLLLLFPFLAVVLLTPTHWPQPGPGEPDWLAAMTGVAGWFALLSNAMAAIWYVSLVSRGKVVHAVALSGLLLGIALSGSAATWFLHSPWLAYHVLTLFWTLLALVILILSWTSHAQAALGPQFWSAERRTQLADFLRQCFPEATARVWVSLCGAFVVLLALRGISVDPEKPYWPIANTLAVSVLLGALAVWSRVPFYVFASGLMFNVIGLLCYTAWSQHRLNAPGALIPNDELVSYFVLAQILSFGIASILWSLIERQLHKKNVDLSGGLALPYPQVSLLTGIHLLAIGIGLANGLHLCGEPVRIGTSLTWISLAVLAVAAVVELWRPQFHRLTRFQLYTCGLLVIGLFLHGRAFVHAEDWFWTATLLVAGYVLAVVVLLRLVPDFVSFADASGSEEGGDWFWQVQLGTIALLLGLSLWITLSFANWYDRLGGALASTLVTVAAFLLVNSRVFASRAKSESFGLSHPLFPCCLVLALKIVIVLEACWSFTDPETMQAVWLQRNAIAVAVLTGAILLYRFVLPRYLPGTLWAEASRPLSAFLAPGCMIFLLVLLGQEFILYDAREGVKITPLRRELAILSGLALLGLTGLAIYSALTKERDSYGIENDWRSSYTYLAEFLAAAFMAHARLNTPDLPQVLGNYWYLSLMVLAFAGVALSEIFTRKNLPVLATPLRRTAMVLAFIPVLAFRLGPLADFFDQLGQQITGLQPFLNRLKNMRNYLMEALCWLLLGMFFSWLARMRRSANYGIFAALAVNFGLWVLLGNQEATTFLQRPQLWLIPLGLIVLVAEHLNREQLGFWPSLSLRYVGLLFIYLSSTIEMFRDGLGQLVILPIVLVLLAVIGMLLGILFRVRAFLLIGFMALLTVIFAQIWHAAVDRSHTWVWWASGIILGILILALFALFEKHRNDVLKVLDNMKRWH